MWFMWLMWAIAGIAIIATIILLTGKGYMLVSGFNTKKPEERAKFDTKKVSKRAGIFMTFIDIGIIALILYLQLKYIPAIKSNSI